MARCSRRDEVAVAGTQQTVRPPGRGGRRARRRHACSRPRRPGIPPLRYQPVPSQEPDSDWRVDVIKADSEPGHPNLDPDRMTLDDYAQSDTSSEGWTVAGKPLAWRAGEIKTPPLSQSARIEAGMLLRRLRLGELVGLPHSRPMPSK